MAYPISKFLYFPIFRVLIRRIKDIENIPKNTPFIIVSNHEHLIDPLYILYPVLKKLNKKVHFLSTGRWWFLGETICRKWAGCIPLFNSKQAYKEAKELINSGKIVGIFPEGDTRRTKDPKTGAVRLAIETNTPILPIAVKSSYLPFNSTMNIVTLFYSNKNKSIKKQTLDLMEEIYRLRNNID